MKTHHTIPVLTAVLGTGAVFFCLTGNEPDRPAEEPEAVEAAEPLPAPAEKTPEPGTAEIRQAPEPARTVRETSIPEPAPEIQLARKPGSRLPPPEPDFSRFWKVQKRRFDTLLNQLAEETDPQKRKSLIQALSRFIRIDTLATLDWIATLETREEQELAFETVQKYALVGIGARIEIDNTGLPLIRETTIMSAVESTGLVAPGDYISGMIRPDGTVIDFSDMPLRQIVGCLRGKPGSEPTLLMMRQNGDGSTTTFDVTVPLSLLVIGPPGILN